MKIRKELLCGCVLSFPGMQCHIEQTIGMGSNAIVYKGWYWDQLHQQEKHYVLIKELFPYHPQGKIWRDEENQICMEDDEAASLFQMHKESFENGNQIHLQLLQNAPESLGANLNSYQLNGTLYTVLGHSGGKSLEEALCTSSLDRSLRGFVRLMLRMLDALEAFHESGYLHLDISPDNILLVGKANDERVLLIDYNSARKTEESASAYLSCKAGYSAPEVEMGDSESICEASDLYSAAAVFFRCLMNRPLSLEEVLQPVPPDAHESPCLLDVPQTVQWKVRGILRKGLCTVAEDRYPSIAAMRRDFLELLDRIDCVGVTHWALWEAGKKSVEELIRTNPALRYVKKEDELYPIRLEYGGWEKMLPEFLNTLLSDSGTSLLTVSQGGMGKTTLLLRTALFQNQRYAPNRAAAFYVSLSGWRAGDAQYIHSQILKHLHFKAETTTFQSAMHELERLLNRPFHAQGRTLPSVLLLLDGINEAHGELQPLYEEIRLLSQMQGVRILAVSRNDAPELTLKTCRLKRLGYEDVENAVASKGVLLPQNETLLQLLRTPLILSIYLKASEGHQQLYIQNQNDLIQAYLDSLYQKELSRLPENAPDRWQTDAALHYVLPAVAAKALKAGHTLRDDELLKVIDECYRVLSSRMLQRAFPQWIGRSRDILGDARTPEEWYGLIVHDILWQRLGMLIRDEPNGYRVFHQIISEHLSKAHLENRKSVLRKKLQRTMCISLIALSVGCAAWMGIWKPYVQPLIDQAKVVYYPKEEAQEVLEAALNRCFSTSRMSEDMMPILDCARSRDLIGFDSLVSVETLYLQQAAADYGQQGYLNTFQKFEADHPENARMPWSENDYAEEEFYALVSMPAEVAVQYLQSLEVLDWLVHSSAWYDTYAEDYIDDLEALVNADLEWVRGSYEQLIAAEMQKMRETDNDLYNDLRRSYPYDMQPPANPEYDLLTLKRNREAIIRSLNYSAAVDRYNQEHIVQKEEQP